MSSLSDNELSFIADEFEELTLAEAEHEYFNRCLGSPSPHCGPTPPPFPTIVYRPMAAGPDAADEDIFAFSPHNSE